MFVLSPTKPLIHTSNRLNFLILTHKNVLSDVLQKHKFSLQEEYLLNEGENHFFRKEIRPSTNDKQKKNSQNFVNETDFLMYAKFYFLFYLIDLFYGFFFMQSIHVYCMLYGVEHEWKQRW